MLGLVILLVPLVARALCLGTCQGQFMIGRDVVSRGSPLVGFLIETFDSGQC